MVIAKQTFKKAGMRTMKKTADASGQEFPGLKGAYVAHTVWVSRV